MHLCIRGGQMRDCHVHKKRRGGADNLPECDVDGVVTVVPSGDVGKCLGY